MARGRGGYSEPALPPRRNPVRIEDVDHIYTGARKAARISDFANEDSEDISRKSHQKDRRLLDDIATKLNKLEFENVKMERGVSMKTGFRRHLYGKSRPPLEKETKEQRRQDELKYPWDYTTDNMFRPPKRKPKNSKEKVEARKKNDRTPMWLKSERFVPTPPKDPYPEYDPMGLYRPREKREHKDYSGCLAAKKYEDMGVREMLANMKAKAAAMPIKRDMARDVDTLMVDLAKPIVRSEPLEYKVPDDYEPDWEYTPDPGLDDRTKGKIRDSRGDLAEFERILDAKFGRKSYGAGALPPAPARSPPPLRAPSRVPPKVDMSASMRQLERELGVDDSDLYGSAQVVREPVVRARTAARSAAGAGGAVRRRTGSNPPPSTRAAVGNRINQAEIEREVEEYMEQPFIRPSSLRNRSGSLDRASSRLPPPLVSPSLVRRSRAGSQGSLAASLERMPGLDPYRPQLGSSGNNRAITSGGYSTAVTPYVPARISRPSGGGGLPPKAPVSNSHFKPEMSDTRKRIREVICMARRDPTYYS